MLHSGRLRPYLNVSKKKIIFQHRRQFVVELDVCFERQASQAEGLIFLLLFVVVVVIVKQVPMLHYFVFVTNEEAKISCSVSPRKFFKRGPKVIKLFLSVMYAFL